MVKKIISECTTCQTLRKICYNSKKRKRHWVPLLSDINRDLRLQQAQSHQNWIEQQSQLLAEITFLPHSDI